MPHDVLRLPDAFFETEAAARQERLVCIGDAALNVRPGDDDLSVGQDVLVGGRWQIHTHRLSVRFDAIAAYARLRFRRGEGRAAGARKMTRLTVSAVAIDPQPGIFRDCPERRDILHTGDL